MTFQDMMNWALQGSFQLKNEAKYNWKTLPSAYFVFPAEVWLGVLEKCSSKDLNIFRNALPELRTHIDRILTNPCYLFEAVFPILAQYLTLNEIRNTRLTCKNWCSAVDKTYDSKFPFSCRNTFNHLPEMDIRLCFDTFLDDVGPVDQYFNMLNNHSRNPIIGRTAHVYSEEAYEDAEMPSFEDWTKLWRDIWHVKFSCKTRLFNEILILCPNIRSIYLNVTCLHPYHEGYPIKINLPNLEQLTLLAIDFGFSEKAHQMPELLIRQYGSQLKILRLLKTSQWPVHQSRLQFHMRSMFSASNFNNLEELSVTGTLDTSDLVKILRRTQLYNVNWIQFSFTLWQNSLLELVRLTHTMPSLTHLKIRQQNRELRLRHLFGWTVSEVNQAFKNMVASSTVKTLELHILTRKIDLSFVLLFPQLRKLLVNVKCLCRGRELQEIDEYGNNLLQFYTEDKNQHAPSLADGSQLPTMWDVLPFLYYVQLKETCKNVKKTTIEFTKGFKRTVAKY